MQGKKQLRNLFLNLLAREATAALATAIVFALTVALNQTAQAQTPTTGGGWTEQVLHSFNDNGTDGNQPEAALISHSAGSLYGTTAWGGIYGYGTVFELTSTAGAGWMEKVLHSFNYNGTDGFQPTAGLILRVADNLYSTTYAGGTHDWGTVFELKPSPDAAGGGWTEKVLHSFNAYPENGTDGGIPYAGLISDAAGDLYGTTIDGGTYGVGTVFELKPSPDAAGGGWTEKVLHSFNNNAVDGFAPYAGLISDAAGNLYGTTFFGGSNALGTVFEMTPHEGRGLDRADTAQLQLRRHGRV